jgi:hypothetical protein
MRKAAVGGGVSFEAPRLFGAAEWACRKANLGTERHKMPSVLATIIFSVAGVEALLAELLEVASAVRNDPKSGNVDDLDDFYQGITQLCAENASLVRKLGVALGDRGHRSLADFSLVVEVRNKALHLQPVVFGEDDSGHTALVVEDKRHRTIAEASSALLRLRRRGLVRRTKNPSLLVALDSADLATWCLRTALQTAHQLVLALPSDFHDYLENLTVEIPKPSHR